MSNTPAPAVPLGRRNLLKGTVLAGGLAAGLGALGTAGAQVTAQAAAHPGMLHSQADFAYIAAKLAAGAQPWTAGWDKLTANPHSQAGWVPRPAATITRGGGVGENYPLLYNDAHACYQNGLRWRIAGTADNRDTAVTIANAWSSTLTEINGNSDAQLAAGLYGYQFANAAELIRDAPGFDLGRFQQMLLDVFYVMNDDFLRNHQGTCDSHYWANWDLCVMCSVLAIGILCEDDALIDQALDYFWNGIGNGSIQHAIPFVYDEYAQWQESGRDQAHSVMGLGLMATFMEMAWHQGIDLWSARDDAFAKACEYVARYNLGHDDVPWTNYSWGSGHNCAYNEMTAISYAARGTYRPVWEMIVHHYTSRRGLALPMSAQFAAQGSPEGGGGDYATTSGGFDALGFGTLLYVRDRAPVASNRLQSFNFPDRYARHSSFTARIDANVNPADDARFTLGAGLADRAADCVSFESLNLPGYYLRHQGFALKLQANDGSAAFAADATFRRVPGLADAGATSLQSYNYPDRHVRHANYVLRVDPVTDAAARADATFRIVS
ncbi:AbfB domain-containing protein [Glycomyces sp. NPDC047369]